ncbi:glycoside hydrolase family 28 protein [Hymenobacter cavernae]|uniref:Endopolygalacturonase n=1 Tax=Hymenobacter cavernae TaxID=2044852 RepID=A0ABQ1UVW4_9BACT|nr:glycoside hydrolase family 28 protein [Hymenobacter cavernae]GGF26783.1 endopolygalacturonase [Hymenobacter cavernae]
MCSKTIIVANRLIFCILLLGLSLLASSASAMRRASRSYVISEYGAVGDGQTLNTSAIQAVIDKCSAAGGGVVVVPAGTFLTGAIFLKPGVNLSVLKDGVLKGSINPDDYPQIQTRWEGVEREWTSALINANNLTGVEISGAGTIDGSGDAWVLRAQQQRQQQPQGTPPATPYRGRPRLICFQNCRQARISSLRLHNQAVWCLHILYSENVVAENLTITADHNIPSSDGIDVDSSKKVRITGCNIDVNDDCISIKSGKDADGLRVNRSSEDIVVEKCRFGYGHGGVAMGSETSGGIRNVEVRNCVMEAGNWAPIRFKSQPSRGGVVENITYRNIKLNDTRKVFEFNMEWRMVPPVLPPAKVLPVVRNVKIVNVSGTTTNVGDIHGLKDSPILNVTFKHCNIKAQKGIVIENARGVDFSGLAIEVKEGKPIVRQENVQ